MKYVVWPLILAANILVPYLLLAEHGRFAASFLFWTLLTIAVLVWAGITTRRWTRSGDPDGDGGPV